MLFALVFAGIFPVAEQNYNRDAQKNFTEAMGDTIINIKIRPEDYEGKN